ncbi:zinc-binding alcohol dehydrogenase family protein [Croceicoccus ponticola]|uniref:Zinc-binding alcohol dehydrogenase family protein n=1 Tax=Croceicoccus ponticola TaxID=2217664 RepID=A0A437GWM4_9SPHN|nr:zinc-binding alcohol dehydrogenase family protein [Croceicoccus ponticola]RVQ66533.1 zinc-binding alcohol dehydrogenase family protein [Croceicoccus ponticola]
MKAAWYSENGGPEVLQYGDLPDPEVGTDRVLVEVEWISIEGGDLLNRLVSPPRIVPFVPGYQAAGRVVATGSAVTRFKAGDRVIAFDWNGSHASLFAAPEKYCYPVPDDLDLRAASTIPVAFGTASDALFEFGRLQPGETVLIQGAAGGVGLAAVQLAAKAGATVIGTASSGERLEKLKAFGLDHGINYRQEDIAERCRELTADAGVDMVLDMAGGKGVSTLLKAMRYRGRYEVIGAATGDVPRFEFFELIRRSATVHAISFGGEMHTPRAHALIDSFSRRMARGDLVMPIERVFKLADAVEAHRFVAESHPFGRVLMQP